MPAWSKKRAETWMREFIAQHQIVPVASLRRTYKGPPDTELIRHWGSVRRALKSVDAPLADASMSKGSGTDTRYYHANGIITSTRANQQRILQVHGMTVRCALCDWKEFHGTAADALEAQTKHLKSHGVTRARKRWKNPPNQPVAGSVPGT